MRIKICRKEAKESRYWLSLLVIQVKELDKKRLVLADEARQLELILGAILKKAENWQ